MHNTSNPSLKSSGNIHIAVELWENQETESGEVQTGRVLVTDWIPGWSGVVEHRRNGRRSGGLCEGEIQGWKCSAPSLSLRYAQTHTKLWNQEWGREGKTNKKSFLDLMDFQLSRLWVHWRKHEFQWNLQQPRLALPTVNSVCEETTGFYGSDALTIVFHSSARARHGFDFVCTSAFALETHRVVALVETLRLQPRNSDEGRQEKCPFLLTFSCVHFLAVVTAILTRNP